MVSCNAATKAAMLSMGSLELLLRASVFTVLDLMHFYPLAGADGAIKAVGLLEGGQHVFGCRSCQTGI